MKYIKRINEWFDSEEMKSNFEKEYLKGELGDEIINKWTIKKLNDPFIYELYMNCPFIHNLKINKSGRFLHIGYSGDDTDKNSFYYFVAEIVDFDDVYQLKVISRDITNDKKVIDESFIKGNLKKEDLFKLMNGRVKTELNKFLSHVKSKYDVEIPQTAYINPAFN